MPIVIVRNIQDHPAHAAHRAHAGPEGETVGASESAAALMLEVAATRSRLEAEIRQANERFEIAQSPVTAAVREAQVELGALVLEAQQELTEIERETRESVNATRDAAVAEAARLLRAAVERATSARARAVSLSSHVADPARTPDEDMTRIWAPDDDRRPAS